jgi:probable HAF family extracellular repeat protein
MVLTLAAASSDGADFTVTVLEKLPGSASAQASGINNAGQVVGTASTPHSPTIRSWAVIWNGSTPTALGTVPNPPGTTGFTGSTGAAINEAGQVVGESVTQNASVITAAVWNGKTPTVLAFTGGPNEAAPCNGIAINNSGQVAGSCVTYSEGAQATLWNGTTPTILDDNEIVDAVAFGINDAGQITGSIAVEGSSQNVAVVWNGTTQTLLKSLGGPQSGATAINAAGRIVGWADTTSGDSHAVLWRGSEVTDLGTLGGTYGINSQALALNAAGDIVGWSWYGAVEGARHAVFWPHHDHKPVDLSDVIGVNEAVEITILEAVGINNRCEIVANGTDNKTGAAQAYLLKPVDPSPCEATDLSSPPP